MPIFNRRKQKDLDQLVEEYTTSNAVNRRQFLQRAMAAGLTVSAATSLLAACGGEQPGGTGTTTTPAKVTSIGVLTQWSGVELDNFNAINAAFTAKTGVKVNVESTRDMGPVLTTRVRGNNPPDVSGMPGTSMFQQLARQGKLVALDSFFDMNAIKQNYAQTWLDAGSVDGKLYAVFPKSNSKGTVWYSPKEFQAAGYTPPTTWDEMIALSNQIAGAGKFPWTMGLESAASSGWPATDWVAQIYLNKYGPDMYDQWVQHKIPWTDPSIKDAFSMFGQIAGGKDYIEGAPQSILATGFQEASHGPFSSPPKSYMYYLGDFTVGFITAQFKEAKAGTDFAFFPFPTINPQFKGAVTGGTDIIAALKDNEGTRQYMQFLSTAEAQSIWVKRGGATSVNKALPLSDYPDDVTRAAGQQLVEATSFRIGAGDLMPSQLQSSYWKGMLDYVSNPNQLDTILAGLEDIAKQAYTT